MASSPQPPQNLPQTLGALRASDYRPCSIREELRRNLIDRMRRNEPFCPGIVGYDLTVIPQLEQAILAKHNFILLGLRGQAKTRILRSLSTLLDEYIPIIAGTPTNDNPFAPVSPTGMRMLREHGDETPIDWLHRDDRYNEKLATPDVTVADLIGDIDPMRVMNQGLTFDSEEAIHFGIVPRSNRGVFAINELPDLQARIQVSLLNILEEGDIQIRGIPLRLPLDLVLVFTANPEDYTNRGSIITPLKDRIDAQILTHYPRTIQESAQITRQEAWRERDGGYSIEIPGFIEEIVEQVAFEARKSDFIDKNSGVSARLTISFMETLYSAIERRLIRHGESVGYPRISDLYASLTAVTGKVELVYKGEQEGVESVANVLIGLAVRTAFTERCFDASEIGPDKKVDASRFRPVVEWFEKGNVLDLNSDMNQEEYAAQLRGVPKLEKLARKHLKPEREELLPLAMEFLLEGLYQHFQLSKQEVEGRVVYVDTLRDMMREDEDDQSLSGHPFL